MNISKITMLILSLFLSIQGFGQIKNKKTESFKVWGNCSMCKKTIENAVFQKNIAVARWNAETQLVVLFYDSTQTKSDILLKKIANAGYDNEKYTADDKIYGKLHGCCQYERKGK
jgi:uncharacterized membrane protein